MNKLIHSEWIKFRTLRGNWFLLISLFIVSFGLLAITLPLFGDNNTPTDIDSRIDAILGPTSGWVALLLAVLGVLVMNSEYRTQTVISSFAAAPIRSEVLAAKAIVLAVVAFVSSAVVTVGNVIIGMIWLDQLGYPLEFGDDHFLQVAAGAPLFAVLAALFGFGIGLLLTNSALAITVVIVIPFIAEPALSALPGDWIEQVLPFTAGSALISAGGLENVEVWQGGATMAFWVAALVIAGAIVFERRDLGNTG